MPTYEYACDACEINYKTMHSINDPPPTACPSCEGTLRRVLAAPSLNTKRFTSPTEARYAKMSETEEIARRRNFRGFTKPSGCRPRSCTVPGTRTTIIEVNGRLTKLAFPAVWLASIALCGSAAGTDKAPSLAVWSNPAPAPYVTSAANQLAFTVAASGLTKKQSGGSPKATSSSTKRG